MSGRKLLPITGLSLVLAGIAGGCISPLEFVNPEFVAALGIGTRSTTQPDEAPGLLVYVENQTNRRMDVLISYRDADDTVQSYTQNLDPGNKSGQMLTCPISEITLGNLGDLELSGVRVSLVDPSTSVVNITDGPYVDVEPFGVLLREDVNYSCGDSIRFVVRPSDASQSGFETIAFFRRTTASQP